MNENFKNEADAKKKRILICAVIAGLSLLLVGAGKVGDGMKEHKNSRQQEFRECTQIAFSMSSAVPAEHKDAWMKLASSNPRLAMRVSCPELSSAMESR